MDWTVEQPPWPAGDSKGTSWGMSKFNWVFLSPSNQKSPSYDTLEESS